MSVASTYPCGPTRSAIWSVSSPAPAATSSTRAPGPTPAMSSISSVAGPSQARTTGVQSFQARAAACHCSQVVSL
jgi:hypothetical protein